MSRVQSKAFFFVIAIVGCIGAALPENQSSEDSVSVRCSALRYAYAEANRRHVNTKGKAVLISEIKGYIVISFIPHKNTLGGSMQVVYDPHKNEIVHIVLGE